jgi:hypothetical protein
MATHEIDQANTGDVQGIYKKANLEEMDSKDAEDLASVKDIVRSCLGSGHTAIAESLQTIYGLPIAEL